MTHFTFVVHYDKVSESTVETMIANRLVINSNLKIDRQWQGSRGRHVHNMNWYSRFFGRVATAFQRERVQLLCIFIANYI